MNIIIERKDKKAGVMNKGYHVVYFMKSGIVYFRGIYKNLGNAQEAVLNVLDEYFGIKLNDYEDYDCVVREEVSLQGGDCDLEYVDMGD